MRMGAQRGVAQSSHLATIRSSKADLRQFLITALEENPKNIKDENEVVEEEKGIEEEAEEEVEEVEAANVVKTLLGGMKKKSISRARSIQKINENKIKINNAQCWTQRGRG